MLLFKSVILTCYSPNRSYPFFMKKPLVIFASFLMLLFAACKKDAGANNNSQASHIATLQADLLGTWYYKELDIAYFYNSTLFLYNAEATAKELHNAPSFQFNKDGTGTYEGERFNYTITSAAGADSLIFGDDPASRFSIVSLSKAQFKFSSTYPDAVVFVNTSNNETLTSNIAQATGTLIHTQAP